MSTAPSLDNIRQLVGQVATLCDHLDIPADQIDYETARFRYNGPDVRLTVYTDGEELYLHAGGKGVYVDLTDDIVADYQQARQQLIDTLEDGLTHLHEVLP